jgi:uncharacterized protein YggE
MSKLRFLGLGLAIAATLPVGMAQAVSTAGASPKAEATPEPMEVAQVFYPPATPNRQVLMVMGHGQVKRAADKAEVAIVLFNYNPYAASENPEAMANLKPMTQAMLKPVLEAIAAAGVPAGDLKVKIGSADPIPSSTDPFAYYGEGSAVIQFDLSQPTQQQVEKIMTAVESVTGGDRAVYLQDRYVTYSTTSCDGLAQEAYVAAVADARDRAQVLAGAMKVQLTDVPSVAESSSFLPGLPYAAIPSPCDLESIPNAAAMGYFSPSSYDPSLPAEVTLQRDLYVTYPIRR